MWKYTDTLPYKFSQAFDILLKIIYQCNYIGYDKQFHILFEGILQLQHGFSIRQSWLFVLFSLELEENIESLIFIFFLLVNMHQQIVLLNKNIHRNNIAQVLRVFYVFNLVFDLVKVDFFFHSPIFLKKHAISISLSSHKIRKRANF